MTKTEAMAFNVGVETVLNVAMRTVEALAEMNLRPIRKELAICALDEFAEAGKALLLEVGRPEPVSQNG